MSDSPSGSDVAGHTPTSPENDLSRHAKGEIALATTKHDKELRDGRSPGYCVKLENVSSIIVKLHVMIPVSCFKLHTLYSLKPGSIVSTSWLHSEDLPVSSGEVRLAWAEFAITGRGRSVRVTRVS